MFMQDTSESSIWRSLAVAFGDGLAFGVGMKLSQHNARPASPAAQSDIRLLAARLGQLEEHVKRIGAAPAAASLDQKVLEAIVNAVEARLQEYSGQAERRLADMEARIAVELKSLDQQDQSVAKRLAQDLAALQGQMLALNRGVTDAVGRIVSEQVAAQVAVRTAPLEGLEERLARDVAVRTAPLETLEERIAGEVKSRVAPLDTLDEKVVQAVASRTIPLETIEERIDARVNSQIAAEQADLEERLASGIRSAIAAEVSARMEPAERNLRDLLGGITRLCQEAVARMEPPAGSAAETPPSETGAPGDSEDNAVPGFAQPQKPGRLWRVPLVSSMVVALGGLILMHIH